MPGLRVIRPADANETAQAWRIAVDADGPTALVLSRQELPVLAETVERAAAGVPRGAYVLRDARRRSRPRSSSSGTGSEVSAVPGRRRPAGRGRAPPPGWCRCPSWDLFAAPGRRLPGRGAATRRAPPGVEAASSFGWERYADASVAIDHFGASAPGTMVMARVRLRPVHVAARADELRRPRRPRVGPCPVSEHPAPHPRGPTMTTLHDLYDQQGQSPWLDNLRRDWLQDGTLAGLVAKGIRGVTSNPTIFAKAISGQDTYDAQFRSLIATKSVDDAYWDLVVDDIVARPGASCARSSTPRAAPTASSRSRWPRRWPTTPRAPSTAARGLHERIDRPNLLVKIPATSECVPAIRQMISEGRSINVTLIFSPLPATPRSSRPTCPASRRYAASGVDDLSGVASVASFFISRVDTEVDRRIEAAGRTGPTPTLLDLRGKAAVAQARLAYALFTERFAGPRWEALAAKGAQVQRPLWASTSTKNPAYPDLAYVDTLIGPDTVNTMPDGTVADFLDHGTVARTVDTDDDGARPAHRPASPRPVSTWRRWPPCSRPKASPRSRPPSTT